jgi:hypothetical protein
MTYTPDSWVIVKVHLIGGELQYRILATWYGGYTQGTSWKLSSGVIKIRENPEYYEFENASGSLYVCYRGNFGMSGYSSSIFDSFKSKTKDGDIFEVISTKDDPLGGLDVDIMQI